MLRSKDKEANGAIIHKMGYFYLICVKGNTYFFFLLLLFSSITSICSDSLIEAYDLAFAESRSSLYNQEVACQHPAACLW